MLISDVNDTWATCCMTLCEMHLEKLMAAKLEYDPIPHFPPHTHTHTHTHTLTHSLTHTHTHSLTHTHTHSLTRSLTHSLTHSHTHTPTHPLTHSLTHSVFPCIKISFLFCTCSLWCKLCWRWIPTNSECCQRMLVTSWMNGVLLRFICEKCFKWMNNSLHYKVFILFQEEPLLCRKQIKRATYILITWQRDF